MRVVVVGGSGKAGSAIVRALGRRGAEAVPLSRSGKSIAGAAGVQADIVTGEGLDTAFEGADAIVDAAESRGPLDGRVFKIGAPKVVASAEKAGVRRAVLLSILGVEKSKFIYHKRKFEQEETYRASALDVTSVRAAQFHDLIASMFEAGAPIGAIPVALGGRFQPVDVGEVAELVADDVLQPTGAEIVELAGPQVRVSRDLAKAWRTATGARGIIVNGPYPPSALEYFRSGANLTEARKGRVTFEQWLARRR